MNIFFHFHFSTLFTLKLLNALKVSDDLIIRFNFVSIVQPMASRDRLTSASCARVVDDTLEVGVILLLPDEGVDEGVEEAGVVAAAAAAEAIEYVAWLRIG